MASFRLRHRAQVAGLGRRADVAGRRWPAGVTELRRRAEVTGRRWRAEVTGRRHAGATGVLRRRAITAAASRQRQERAEATGQGRGAVGTAAIREDSGEGREPCPRRVVVVTGASPR